MTPELRPRLLAKGIPDACWREIIQSGAEQGEIDSIALEQLIDLQRNRESRSEADR